MNNSIPDQHQLPPTILGNFRNMMIGILELFFNIGIELVEHLSSPKGAKKT